MLRETCAARLFDTRTSGIMSGAAGPLEIVPQKLSFCAFFFHPAQGGFASRINSRIGVVARRPQLYRHPWQLQDCCAVITSTLIVWLEQLQREGRHGSLYAAGRLCSLAA